MFVYWPAPANLDKWCVHGARQRQAVALRVFSSMSHFTNSTHRCRTSNASLLVAKWKPFFRIHYATHGQPGHQQLAIDINNSTAL